MSNPLYVFDMDETLFDADCATLWNEFLVEKGIATESGFLEEDQRLMALYAQGKMEMEEYLKFSMSPLSGVSKETVSLLVEQCIDEKILPRLYPQAATLIEQLKRDKIRSVIISASVSFLVSAIGKRIGIDEAMGIDLVEEGGHYTATIAGTPTYREGKVERLQQWLDVSLEPFTPIHFYTDSINDRSLCEYADHVYLVNPCPLLKALGEKKRWQQLTWSL
ncbi:phosphoserine phosphatase [Vibrio maritimus]|uniref:Phosphoserine phosphatase n=1 Tax=Vibrio maritimus TaxID=990268 RepID=A0A090T9P5_9VIBR|nr:phosphoserine phosphatase [Vibrio maritimus]